MTEGFDPRAYWRGDTQNDYTIPASANSPEQERAELVLRRALSEVSQGFAFEDDISLHGHQPRDILEIGPGRGRITRILREFFPDARYTGVDISNRLATEVWPGGTVVVSPIQDWAAPVHSFDLVLTSEVLMHVPPNEVGPVIGNLLLAARGYLLLLEWMPVLWEVRAEISPWNWPHDYLTYLGHAEVWRTDRQAIFLVDMANR